MTRLGRLIVFFSYFSAIVSGCFNIAVSSDRFATILLRQVALDDSSYTTSQKSGRPVYRSDDHSHFLYHGVFDGHRSYVGRWILSRQPDYFLEDTNIIAHVQTWSILPHLSVYSGFQPFKKTYSSEEFQFINDESLQFVCVDDNDADTTLFFQSDNHQRQLSGFYVQRYISTQPNYEVFSLVKTYNTDLDFYLFRLSAGQSERGENAYLIGETVDVDAGLAYVLDLSPKASEITSMWRFVRYNEAGEFSWVEDASAGIYSLPLTPQHLDPPSPHRTDRRPVPVRSIYDVLLFHRKLRSLPTEHSLVSLRNGVTYPSVGLGTGGIPLERSLEIFSAALREGYRLFDLAREYGNEGIMREAIQSSAIPRSALFLQTKVWPTYLGFWPTVSEVLKSLDSLGTSYLDLVMLHWPFCYRETDWFHCQDTVEPEGTWRESLEAMLKLYAEGKVMALGVSNFNLDLLMEVAPATNFIPHVVQNFATLHDEREAVGFDGEGDVYVREWCRHYRVAYQPYASARNRHNFPVSVRTYLSDFARELRTTEYAVILACFLQGDSVMIPRSASLSHLVANIQPPPTLTPYMLERLGCGVDYLLQRERRREESAGEEEVVPFDG